jgi:hypothetical protein
MIFLLTFACAGPSLNSERSFATVAFTDPSGVEQVDTQAGLRRYSPVDGVGCETGTELSMTSDADPRPFTFRGVYGAEGRGAERPERPERDQHYSVVWLDSADPEIVHSLAESEVTVVTDTDALIELVFDGGRVGTSRFLGDDPVFEPQAAPITVRIELPEEGGLLDEGAVDDGANDLTVDPETGNAICTPS